MICSQRVADDLPDGSRVGLYHVLRAVERSGRLQHGLRWQREYLKEVAIKRDEVLVDQGVACHEVVIKGALEERTNLIEAVVGQTVAISDQDEKHIEQELMLAEAAPEAIAYEAMLDESEAAGNLADPLGAQGTLFNHHAPPCP
jgi:fructose-specific component phosphotransferase system IIB-like protein